MKWYLARLVFKVICGNGDHKPQFDEQVRLISAEDDLHAFRKARVLGNTGSPDISNSPVKWKFLDVIELHAMAEFIDGIEIFSMIKESNDAEEYENNIRKTAALLLQDSLHPCTGLN